MVEAEVFAIKWARPGLGREACAVVGHLISAGAGIEDPRRNRSPARAHAGSKVAAFVSTIPAIYAGEPSNTSGSPISSRPTRGLHRSSGPIRVCPVRHGGGPPRALAHVALAEGIAAPVLFRFHEHDLICVGRRAPTLSG